MVAAGHVAGLAVAQGPAVKVVRVKDSRAKGDNAYREDLVAQMVNRSVEALTGKTGADAWRTFFKPDDVVGVKVNCLFGVGASTHPEVTKAIVQGIISAGVKPSNIIVWDRTNADLIKVGYEVNTTGPGPLCYGTDGDYEPQPTRNGTFHGRLSKILTRKITALVNVPILKDHRIAGMTCALKNHYGSFDNPGAHHKNHCNPQIADVNAVPAIKDKTRLVICDCIRPLAHGGPGLRAENLWEQSEILASVDPVALDTICLQILEARRKAAGFRSLAEEGRYPAYIASAAERGVGTNDMAKIDVVQITTG